MDRLTIEEVKHVAHLARIKVSEDELNTLSYQLKELIDEIDKIKDVEISDEDILITPVDIDARVREDEVLNTISFESVKTNLPKKIGNFVEVPVMINE